MGLYSHPFLSSYIANKLRESSSEAKDEKSRPSVASYSGTFAVLELLSIPTYAFVADRLVKALSNALVSPAIAAASVIIANLTAIGIEYAGFRFIWKRKVLHDMPKGTAKDELRGFISEFQPLRIFSKIQDPKPARTACGYVGQLWGVIERHFIWIQGLRAVFAAGMTLLLDVQPRLFVDTLFGAMAAWGFGWVVGAITAKYYESISHRIEENNKSMGDQNEVI